jgi:glutathione peroxidase-family protein
MNRTKNLALALSLVSSFALGIVQPQFSTAAENAPAAQAAEVGKDAPGFTLPGIDGKNHSLSDYKGKYVVLEWVNFGCPFVKKHYGAKNMQKLQEAYTAKGVTWLTICSSAKGKQGNMPIDEIKKKLTEEGWKGTEYLVDEDGKVGRAYDAKTTPDMYILNKKHELVYAGAIDDINSPDQSDIPKAHNYVKAALDEELAGKKIATASSKSYGCSVKYND